MRLTRVAGRYCLELDLAEEGGPTFTALAEKYQVDPTLVLGDLLELQRNQPVLEALSSQLEQPLADALGRERVEQVKASCPLLVEPPPGGPEPLERLLGDRPFPSELLEFPLRIDETSGALLPGYRLARGDDGFTVEELPGPLVRSLGELEERLKTSARERVAALPPAERAAEALRAGLDLGGLRLPAQGTIYVEVGDQHLVFDPGVGPAVGRLGSVT